MQKAGWAQDSSKTCPHAGRAGFLGATHGLSLCLSCPSALEPMASHVGSPPPTLPTTFTTVSRQFLGAWTMAKVAGRQHGAKAALPFPIPAIVGREGATPPAIPRPADACLAAGTPRRPHPRHVPSARHGAAGPLGPRRPSPNIPPAARPVPPPPAPAAPCTRPADGGESRSRVLAPTFG